ncbi:class I SAM-dependent methyltransferase [Natronorubrum sp. FCH18a]|uniref:class I SAM-dependent methyltransferase n=1 Tax=Natronorubrum sp. FCH18a TaxID=3447018 RepID=UPI003F50ECEB
MKKYNPRHLKPSSIDGIRKHVKKLNSRIDGYLAPPKQSRIDTYKAILSGINFSKALHFGSGRDKRGISTQLGSRDSEVVSIDPDMNGLEQNQMDMKVRGDGQRLPFEDNSFDLVFSEYVFEHLPDPQSALEEIDRVLRPEGSFVVLVPNPRHYYARIADITPFWFHKFWFRLQGIESAEDDRFPTQFEWGTYADVKSSKFDWSLEHFYSFPGPTGYTKILPVHFIFTLFARAMSGHPEFHVSYIAHYRKGIESDDRPLREDAMNIRM